MYSLIQINGDTFASMYSSKCVTVFFFESDYIQIVNLLLASRDLSSYLLSFKKQGLISLFHSGLNVSSTGEEVIDLLVEEALDGCLDESGLVSISPMLSYVSTASSIEKSEYSSSSDSVSETRTLDFFFFLGFC